VVAANVDVVLVVVAIDRPLNPASAERALALVWESGAAPVLVLNKADLSPDPEREADAAAAVAPGVPAHLASARDGAGLDAVAAHLGPGRTGAVVGPSGAGKSTLVNRLLDAEAQATGDVREWDRRGRHTTTSRELVRLPAGGVLIDTPGMREMGMWDAEAGLDSVFADIEALAASCAFRDCAHASEPGCAVRGAVAEGTLDPRRLQSWVKLRRELAWQERRHDLQARLAEQRRWKRLARAHRRRDEDRE
jgi:ribosome biogenesis GTPase